MRINDLLRMPVDRVDTDAQWLRPFAQYATGLRMPELRASGMDAIDVRMGWLRKHDGEPHHPTRRVWVCGFVMVAGHPVALLAAGGRRGADDGSLLIFDRDGFVEAVRRMTGRWTVRVRERGVFAPNPMPYDYNDVSVIDPRHHDRRIGVTWGSCLWCAWTGRENLDSFVDQPESTGACALHGCRR